MHELTVIENMLDIVFDTAREHGLNRIGKVEMAVGRMNQMVPDMLVFAFETATANTIANGARLEIDWIRVQMKCYECLMEYTVDHQIYLCPACGSPNSDCLAGNELYVKSIEGE